MNDSIETPKNCIALSHARRFGKSHVAAMIVELKYDKSADVAIRQIKEKRYHGCCQIIMTEFFWLELIMMQMARIKSIIPV